GVQSWEVVVIWGAQESEAIGKGLQHTLGKDQSALFGLRLQDFEDQLLLAHACGADNVEIFGDLRQGGNVHFLKFSNVHTNSLGFLCANMKPSRKAEWRKSRCDLKRRFLAKMIVRGNVK